MQETLLRTKLFFPQPRPNHVPRPRLIGQLNQGLHLGQKLTLISAPAGFGKTTLIAEWGMESAQSPTPPSLFGNPHLSWLSLDEGDNDLTRFLTYFIAALQTAVPEVGEAALALLQASPQAHAQAVQIALINDLAAVPQNMMLVLDDYHLIDSQEVDEALFFILDNLPPNMHLVIATRVDLSLPLGGMRGRGQLNELRAADLRFNNAEAAAFLNQVMGLNLKPEDIAALEKRTEGWVAGLQLAAISMQGRENIPGLIDAFSGSHRFVMDYLAEEVLKQQAPEVHDFLLQTAVLDRLNGPLCDAVRFGESPSSNEVTAVRLGEREHFQATTGGQAMLEMLERANLFIIPLDEERRWYRYHHLFADLLHQRAAALVERVEPQMEASFQTAVWLKWARAIPEELVLARPVLCARYASALIDSGKLEEVERWLHEAEKWLEAAAGGTAAGMIVEDEESFPALPATITLNRANLASYQADNAGAIKYAELALELLPEENLMQRAQAAVMRGITYWTLGDLPAAQKALVDWMDSSQKFGIPIFTIASAFGLADILVGQGRLQEAINTYDEALQLAQDVDHHLLPITAHHHLGLAMIYHEMGEGEKAAHHLQISSELGRKSTLIDWPYRRAVAHARLKESAGDLDAALALLDEAERVYIPNPAPDMRPAGALRAGIYLKQGRLQLAQEWVRERDLSADDDLSYLREFEHITLARVLVAEYQESGGERAWQQAGSLLERLLAAAEEGKRAGSMLEILIVQAIAYQARGDIPAALIPLQQALSLAEPQGYLHIFLDEGPPMSQLIREATARGIMPAYTAGLLSDIPAIESQELGIAKTTSDIRHRSSEAATSDIVEPLSPRELEVLNLIADGLTNKQIADRLYLSPHTIKVHTRNIYAKLDAHHRTEAVARARELGLI
jgi:LuxR family transcriptional regulator, maltose regulon positive regulatory protein